MLWFDLHHSDLISWYMKVDPGRFENIVYATGLSVYEVLPVSLGLHGFPNYTAPIYTVSFVVLLGKVFSKAARTSWRKETMRILFFSLGV